MKNLQTSFSLLLFYILSIHVVFTQNIPQFSSDLPLPCCADHHIREYYNSNPEALQQYKSSFAIKRAVPQTDSYVIPVVFHIFGEDFSGLSVTDEIVRDALRKTNEDFQGITFNWGDDDPEFDKRKQKMNITFRLAEKDPNGVATTGIIYHRLESGFGNYGAPRLPYYAWDNRRYMNVYIMNDLYGDGVTNNSGVSWYPDEGMAAANLARVVYNGRYLGINAGEDAYGENFRRVLTHEFGHFFNLAHTFDYDASKFPDGCNDANGLINPGDYVDDTPPADRMLMGASDLNCKGEKTNWTNFMNYSYERTSMFTAGQVERMVNALSHSSRITLWNESTREQVFFSNPQQTRIALCSRGDIMENAANDGSFSNGFRFTVIEGTLATKTFSYRTDFTMKNLPEGLSPRLVRESETALTLYLDGKALKHEEADNLTNLSIHFNNSILSTGTDLYSCDLPLALAFRSSYGIVYSGEKYMSVSPSSIWSVFQINPKNEDSYFGIMYDYGAGRTGNLFIESYGKPMVGTGRGQNLEFINYGEEIGTESRWVECGDYPALGTLCSSSFTFWKGKIGFVGIQLEGATPGETLYGWMRVIVGEEGKSFTLIDYAFNEEPGKSIRAGQKSMELFKSEVIYSTNTLHEDPYLNDGTISERLIISIMGENQLTKTGKLELGTDYQLNNLPAGLTPILNVITPTQAELSLEGKALEHEARNSGSRGFLLEPNALSHSDIASSQLNLNFVFVNPYQIRNGKGNWTVNNNSPWIFFRIDNLDEAEYGAWVYASKHLKLETYQKPMVCKEGTSFIAPLPPNSQIGADSYWKAPSGEYGKQLDIRSTQFTDWEGQTAYAGFSFDKNGNTHYGWMKISVTTDGTSFTVNEWAYNEAPGQSILAGGTDAVNPAESIKDEILIFPNPTSDYLHIVASEGTKMSVYTMTGSLITMDVLEHNKISLPVYSWAKGIYLIHFVKDNSYIVKKVMVN